MDCFILFCLGLAVLQRQGKEKWINFFPTTVFVEQPIYMPRYPYMIIFISAIRFSISIFCVCLFMCKKNLVVCIFLSFQKILFQRKKENIPFTIAYFISRCSLFQRFVADRRHKNKRREELFCYLQSCSSKKI